jgi:EAL and modified HD-GYP domain-containing signal transduction protein
MREPPAAGASTLPEPVRAHNPHVAIFRQAVVEKNRTVRAYALRTSVATADGGWFAEDEVEHLAEAEYEQLDLAALGGDRPVILRATRQLVSGEKPMPLAMHGLMLEIGAGLAEQPDTRHHAAALRARGVDIVVGDYAGTAEQDELLPMAWAVKVNVRTDLDRLRDLASHVHTVHGKVVAEGVATPSVLRRAFADGADLVQGPLLQREPDGPLRKAKAGELQCLEVISLLSAPDIDLEAVQHMVAADPELSIRVLHVVNSSAFALHHTVDSLRHAVILLGPHRLAALAMASLIDARPAAIGPLWTVLTRALTCRELAGEDAGYTVGLLSAVASQQRIDVESLLAKAGVSPEVALALEVHAGPLGQVLAAVLAHEENDAEQVVATGLDPFDVAHAYLDAVPEALSTATALSMDPLA